MREATTGARQAAHAAPRHGCAIALPRSIWMLGTGIHTDDVRATLVQVDRQLNANVATTMWWIAGIALASVVLIGRCGQPNASESRSADAGCDCSPGRASHAWIGSDRRA